MVPYKKSILVSSLILMRTASLIRIDMEASRKVLLGKQSKPPHQAAMDQLEEFSGVQEGNEAMAEDNYHLLEIRKVSGDSQAKQQHQQQQWQEETTKCQNACMIHSNYQDCTKCAVRMYPGSRVQAEKLYASTQQCHCHVASGAELVFALVPEE